MGSPWYMSPEQMRNARDVDTRTDIWSMGVVIFELLTEATPFSGRNLTGISLERALRRACARA